MRRTTALAASVLLFCAVVVHPQAATITVINTNDSCPGSLRQALANANDGDTIHFAVTGTISLTSGELLVDKNIVISGPMGRRFVSATSHRPSAQSFNFK
jgi:hypothetical protein